MKNLIKLFLLYCFHITIIQIHCNGQIQLPDIFCDHMVLQRRMPIPIWGTSGRNGVLEINLDNIQITVQADNFGNWKATLPPMKEGGPFEIIISSKNETVRIKDIYIGEVWICSGQSNMEWALHQTVEGEGEIPKANYPLIRFFHLKKKHDTYKTPYSKEQLKNFSEGQYFHKPKWELCSPETASAFSGVGYFFGKKLHHSLDVPIGLIQAAVGGSPCQSWVGKDALASHPQLKHLVDGEQSWINSTIIHPWLVERAKQNWANWGKTETTTLPGHPFAPNYLFDSAIKPLAPYAIGGVIWYQGESNATHPQSYTAMMKMLLISWRSLWKQGDFPFYFVQLPKIGNRNLWPEFREAQQNCLSNPNTGMIVTLDQGHATDVHPREKEIVGKRLADLALSKTYYQHVQAESPMFYTYDWQKIEHKIVLHFKNTYDGLKINNGYGPEGFYLQGYLRQGTVETIIAPEKIVVAKNEIIITYPTDFLPVKVKYAWAPFPENNLTNSSGLPLAPFKLELEGLN